jgi:dethiobiotin synthetase
MSALPFTRLGYNDANTPQGGIMAHRIFVTATNTDVGKTYTTLRLLEYYASQGLRVGALKPIETGVTDFPPDGAALLEMLKRLNPAFCPLDIEAIVPIQYPLPAAPYVASGRQPVDWNRINKALERIEPLCDIVIIEGAGGLLVPLDEENMMIDVIRRYGAKALLVSHCRLGCINDTLLNLELLDAAKIPYEWILNCRPGDDSFKTVSKPFFDDRFSETPLLDTDLPRIAEKLLQP